MRTLSHHDMPAQALAHIGYVGFNGLLFDPYEHNSALFHESLIKCIKGAFQSKTLGTAVIPGMGTNGDVLVWYQ